MLNETDLEEYFEMLKKKQKKYGNKNSPIYQDIKPLIDQQVDLLQKLIEVQTKITTRVLGFKP